MDGRITLAGMVEQLCEKPARIFGMYPQKGTIAVGSDADLAIFDLAGVRGLKATHKELKIDYSLYQGMSVTSPPDLVFLRGKAVAEKGVVSA